MLGLLIPDQGIKQKIRAVTAAYLFYRRKYLCMLTFRSLSLSASLIEKSIYAACRRL